MNATNRFKAQEWLLPRALAAGVILALGAFPACKDVTLDRANQSPVPLANP